MRLPICLFVATVMLICAGMKFSSHLLAQDDVKQVETEKQGETEKKGDGNGENNADTKTDDAKTGDTKTPDASKADPNEDETYEEILKRWQDVDSQLKSLATKFESETDTEKKATIRKEYADIVGYAKTVAERLRNAALSSYKAAPNENEQVTRLLIGAIVDDIYFGRYDDALQVGQVLIEGGVDAKHLQALRNSDRLSLLEMKKVDEIIRRHDEFLADDLPRVKLETSKGVIEIELFENEAPGTVGNFISLIENELYDGVKFHRVIDGFVAQGGDPKGDGTGGPGYKIKSEFDKPNAREHYRGYVSMANSGQRDTGGSQFFIIYSGKRTEPLNGKHTVFGRVVSGMDVADKLTRIDPDNPATKDATADTIIKAEVLRKREHEYVPDKVPGSDTTTDETKKDAE